MKTTLDNWQSLMDKYDLIYYMEYQTTKETDLEQMREDWKVMRRYALNKLNDDLQSIQLVVPPSVNDVFTHFNPNSSNTNSPLKLVELSNACWPAGSP